MKTLIPAIVCAALAPGAGAASHPTALTVLVGSYSAPADSALRVYSLDTATCTAQPVAALPVDNVSYLTVAPDGTVHALSETGPATSAVTSVRPGGQLSRQPVGADSPCHIAISPDGRFAATADYGDGTVAIFPVLADGTLGRRRQLVRFSGSGPVERRQQSSHPHCIAFTPDGRHMLVTDLGTDSINLFGLVAGADSLVADRPDRRIAIAPGSGPRHIVFNSRGDMAYLINEISDTVTVLSYDGSTLQPVQYIAADNADAHGAGDVRLSPDGRHLYASLRLRHDGIATFSVDPVSGLLSHMGHTPTGGHPRNLHITPDGRLMLVACRDADAVEIYRIDPATGALTRAGTIPQPRAVFTTTL